VRLPTVDEFHAALGSTDALDVAATTWNQDNSGGQTKAVATKAANANGFYDLLGNVAEWLAQPASMDPQVAPIIGGNVQTGADSVRNAPMATQPIDSHNPYTGFRFVVNNDDSVPVMPPAASAPTSPSAPATRPAN
jgi:formylglycine-generating enzyme required for sulfatase activity